MNTRQHIHEVIKRHGINYHSEHIVLANGGVSPYFFDVKQAFSQGGDLLFLADAMDALTREHGMEYNVVGGMELGAVPIAIALAVHGPASRKWFAVRKRRKGRGTNKLIEGYMPTQYDNVLIVEDVVTTGTTLVNTFKNLQLQTHIVGAITVVDRSNGAALQLAREHGFRYASLFTSQDFI